MISHIVDACYSQTINCDVVAACSLQLTRLIEIESCTALTVLTNKQFFKPYSGKAWITLFYDVLKV